MIDPTRLNLIEADIKHIEMQKSAFGNSSLILDYLKETVAALRSLPKVRPATEKPEPNRKAYAVCNLYNNRALMEYPAAVAWESAPKTGFLEGWMYESDLIQFFQQQTKETA